MDAINIDEALVRFLLHEQHPDLAGLELREVPGGWDNKMWRLGEEFAVRLPRTPRASSLLRYEQLWLPALAPRLPLPIPTPVRVGEPSVGFPRIWNIVSWVAGEPADRTPISRPEAAERLAGFLRALHRRAPEAAPANPKRGVSLGTLEADFHERLAVVASRDVAADARRVWDQAAAAPAWGNAPLWLHGDLHPANVVVSDGMLCGVIDFGEMCAGDPATDLAAAWVLLPAGTAPRFLDAYGDVNDATIRRARGWAVLQALSLMGVGQQWEKGLPGGQQTWGPAGQGALDRALSLPRVGRPR
jgi:aminoglycoside phosphotransferase (APT) family kinase protein